jgi:hypothetical protein
MHVEKIRGKKRAFFWANFLEVSVFTALTVCGFHQHSHYDRPKKQFISFLQAFNQHFLETTALSSSGSRKCLRSSKML